jgi:hypothetical protein
MPSYRNITVSIDAEDYHTIRIWCAMRNVSLSRVVKTFLKDLPRLEKVRRFPLPEAPQEDSLGELFDELDIAEIERVKHLLEANRHPLPREL